MREVEVKFRVDDVDTIVQRLLSRGWKLGEPSVQDDQAFAPQGWDYHQSKIGVTFPRLRTVAGQHTFTVKQPLENAMSCAEHETPVADRMAMHAAVELMGFYATVRIRKTRRSAESGGLSVCLDVVEGLGAFLELERMVADGQSGDEVQAELVTVARSLGVDGERVTDTYDSLVRAALLAA